MLLALMLPLLVMAEPPVSRWSVKAGELRLADTGLSRQQYRGPMFGITAQHENLYRHSEHLRWTVRAELVYSPTVNVSRSARIHYAGLRLAYETHYSFPVGRGFSLEPGGYLEALGAVKYQTRNVNNIATGDVMLNLHLSLRAQYIKQWSRFGLRAGYRLSTPFLGLFFAPDYGQSYYELSLGLPSSLGPTLCLGSFHNHQALLGDLQLDLIFPHGALILGFGHEHRWWHAHGLEYQCSSLTACLGFALRLSSLRPY